MKVLFVGEGPTDVGSAKFAVPPRRATGFLFLLSRRICPTIADHSLSMFWREISIRDQRKKANIYATRVIAAAALATKHGCDAVVIVVDRESRDENRMKEMLTAFDSHAGFADGKPHIICGEAILSIEAWVLGSPSALAQVLNLDVTAVQSHYKPGRVEDMNPRSGKPENHSKKIVEKIVALAHREDDTPFREEIANHANIEEIYRHCDKGFRPFVDKLRRAINSL